MHSVKLISYSQPVESLKDQGINNAQELIAYCARVSNPSNELNTKTSDKLIKYLIKHKHWSPLEMVDATLLIETTRDIGRQILRHRSFVFQEFSQRYANPVAELDFCFSGARMQDETNRQNSFSCDNAFIKDEWQARQDQVLAIAKDHYTWAIGVGVAKEVARKVLPEGLTRTKMYMKGSMRSWIHYIEIRTGEETQKEHREVAIACAQVLSEVFPMLRM